MKIILMLIVGLMLAGCESTENHVRNRDAVDRNRYLVEHRIALELQMIAGRVDTNAGLPSCSVLIEIACVRQELDCKMQV